MFAFYNSMIAFQVLEEMRSFPPKYDLSTHKGRLNMYNLAVFLANKNVKSFRGAFDQASLIGFCIASDWSSKNKPFVLQDKEKCLRDLVLLNGFVSGKRMIFEKAGKKPFYSSIESAVLKGFHNGYLLGLRYAVRKNVVRQQVKLNKRDYLGREIV